MANSRSIADVPAAADFTTSDEIVIFDASTGKAGTVTGAALATYLETVLDIPDLEGDIQDYVDDAQNLAQQASGNVTLADGTDTGKPSAYRSQQLAAGHEAAAGSYAAAAEGAANEAGTHAITSQEAAADALAATDITERLDTEADLTGKPAGTYLVSVYTDAPDYDGVPATVVWDGSAVTEVSAALLSRAERPRAFSTIADAVAATDLRTDTEVQIAEEGRGGRFRVVAAGTGTEDGGALITSTGSGSKQLQRLTILERPRVVNPAWFEHYFGEQDAESYATRVARGEANAWALWKAVAAGAGGVDASGVASERRSLVVHLDDHLDVLVPSALTPSLAWAGTVTYQKRMIWLPENLRSVRFEGPGSIRFLNSAMVGRYGNDVDGGDWAGLIAGRSSRLELALREVSHHDYGFTLDTFLCDITAGGNTVTVRADVADRARFDAGMVGKTLVVQANRDTDLDHDDSGSLTYYATVSAVSGDGYTATVTNIVRYNSPTVLSAWPSAGTYTNPYFGSTPLAIDPTKTALCGIVLDHLEYADRLDDYGQVWGAVGGMELVGALSNTNPDTGGGTDTPSTVVIESGSFPGSRETTAVEMSDGDGYRMELHEGVNISGHYQAMGGGGSTGNTASSVYWKDFVVEDCGHEPVGFVDEYRSTNIGGAWYFPPNVSHEVINGRVANCTGFAGKFYSASSIDEAPLRSVYRGFVCENNLEAFQTVSTGLTQLYGCRFIETPISVGQYADFYACEMDGGQINFTTSTALANGDPRRMRWMGGAIESMGPFTSGYADSAVEFHHMRKVLIDSEGVAGFEGWAMGWDGNPVKLTINSVARFELVNVPEYLLNATPAGSVIQITGDNRFYGTPGVRWIGLTGGADYDVVVDGGYQDDRSKNFMHALTTLNNGVLTARNCAGLLISGNTVNTSENYIDVVTGSATWDPPSLAAGASATYTLTVNGARVGDYVEALSFSLALAGTVLEGEHVSADNTLSYIHRNPTGSTVNLASGTLRARVRKST